VFTNTTRRETGKGLTGFWTSSSWPRQDPSHSCIQSRRSTVDRETCGIIQGPKHCRIPDPKVAKVNPHGLVQAIVCVCVSEWVTLIVVIFSVWDCVYMRWPPAMPRITERGSDRGGVTLHTHTHYTSSPHQDITGWKRGRGKSECLRPLCMQRLCVCVSSWPVVWTSHVVKNSLTNISPTVYHVRYRVPRDLSHLWKLGLIMQKHCFTHSSDNSTLFSWTWTVSTSWCFGVRMK